MSLLASDGLSNARLDGGLGPAFDANGKIAYFAGAAPASANNAIANTKLADFTLAADAFPAAATRKLTANAIASVKVLTAGTVGFAVMYRSTDTVLTNPTGATDRRLVFSSVGGRTTTTTVLAGGEATIPATDTTAFPANGSIVVGTTTVTYTGKTGTSFTGCVGTPAAGNGTTIKQANVDLAIDLLTFLGNETVTLPTLVITDAA